VLQRSIEDSDGLGGWSTVARAQLTPASTFSLALPRRRGTYRVCRPADAAHGSGVSNVFRRTRGETVVMSGRANSVVAAATICVSHDDP
jgi:hypothetical protein